MSNIITNGEGFCGIGIIELGHTVSLLLSVMFGAFCWVIFSLSVKRGEREEGEGRRERWKERLRLRKREGEGEGRKERERGRGCDKIFVLRGGKLRYVC
jgi:hypothetical protein